MPFATRDGVSLFRRTDANASNPPLLRPNPPHTGAEPIVAAIPGTTLVSRATGHLSPIEPRDAVLAGFFTAAGDRAETGGVR